MTVLTMVSTTPLLTVPGGGAHAFVQVGGSKLHAVPHSTVLFDEQSKEKPQPPGGGMTVKLTRHEAWLDAQSYTVTVIGKTPTPTVIPAGGDWEQPTTPQLSEAHTDAGRQRSGIVPAQP